MKSLEELADYGPETADETEGSGAEAPDPVIACDERLGAREHRLLVPLKVDGRWLRRITLRLPSQGDIDDLGNGILEGRRALLCRLTGLHPLIIRALRWPDSRAVHEMFIDILPDFLKE